MREIVSPLSGIRSPFGQRRDPYKVLGFKPGLVADFGAEYYRANLARSTFADTLTHAATSNATMVDSDGLLKWRPHNLLTHSEDFSNAAWTKSDSASVTANQVVAPNGAMGADLIDLSGSDTARVVQGSFGTVFTKTAGVWLRSVSGSGTFPIGYFESGGDYVNTLVALTENWQFFELSIPADGSNFAFSKRPLGTNPTLNTAYAWGAHVYRSDLGGMVNNPDRGDSYVPTTSAAVYMPRRGHHVWNGSAWVDAGYFHEKFARTNFLLSADDLSNASYWSPLSGASTPVATSPIMGANAWTLSGAGYLRQSGLSIAASTTHTVWLRMRLPSSPAAGKLRIRIYDSNSGTFVTLANGSTVSDFVYDTSGAVTRDTSAVDFLIDEGNGVYLVGAAFTTLATVTTHFVFIYPDVSNNTQPVDVATPQLEEGSTPSSYSPTNGAAATRAAETLTAPSANLPWPTPQVIGDELVTNGTFDTDTDWTKGTGWTISGGVASSTTDGQFLTSSVGSLTVGKTYKVSFDITSYTSGTARFYSGGFPGIEGSAVGTVAGVFTAQETAVRIYSSAFVGSIDNISVREIDPLAVSIQMEGRMAYADTGAASEVEFLNWEADSNNLIDLYLSAASTATGRVVYRQKNAGTSDVVETGGTAYSPGINVPFNIASRHGSNFLNGAVDGTVLTEDTTPVALPDLSSTDMEIGYDFMGTIKTLRLWADDIGDTGLAEAST